MTADTSLLRAVKLKRLFIEQANVSLTATSFESPSGHGLILLHESKCKRIYLVAGAFVEGVQGKPLEDLEDLAEASHWADVGIEELQGDIGDWAVGTLAGQWPSEADQVLPATAAAGFGELAVAVPGSGSGVTWGLQRGNLLNS